MKKNLPQTVSFLVIIGLLFGGAFWYILTNSQKTSPDRQYNKDTYTPPVRESNSKVVIDDKEILEGAFESVSNGRIFYKSGEELIQYDLNKEEIAITCTDQVLANVEELDFDLVTKVRVVSLDEIDSIISKGEFIVLFADDLNTAPFIHTIAVNSSVCEN